MKDKKLLRVVVLSIMLCVVIGTLVEETWAQSTAKSVSQADHDLASKRGLEVLGSVKRDVPEATRLQKAIGIGSLFVMVAVLKWL